MSEPLVSLYRLVNEHSSTCGHGLHRARLIGLVTDWLMNIDLLVTRSQQSLVDWFGYRLVNEHRYTCDKVSTEPG